MWGSWWTYAIIAGPVFLFGVYVGVDMVLSIHGYGGVWNVLTRKRAPKVMSLRDYDNRWLWDGKSGTWKPNEEIQGRG